jgi:hypothetical protein
VALVRIDGRSDPDRAHGLLTFAGRFIRREVQRAISPVPGHPLRDNPETIGTRLVDQFDEEGGVTQVRTRGG